MLYKVVKEIRAVLGKLLIVEGNGLEAVLAIE